MGNKAIVYERSHYYKKRWKDELIWDGGFREGAQEQGTTYCTAQDHAAPNCRE